MRLQSVIIPDKEQYSELYFRGSLTLAAGDILTFDTYFNSFSYTKYREYTTVEDVCFSCKFSGRARVELCLFDGEERIVCGGEFSGQAALSADFSALSEHGFLYPKITALTDVSFESGEYSANYEPQKISFCIAICTYKRENYVLKNTALLRDYKFSFIERVFVIDNGNTLDCGALSDDFIKVLPNRNFGGSGGFSRGMLQAYDGNFTHVILMDDDVEFYPEILETITVFISVLREEYRNSRFSAAMLFLSQDTPYLQWAMGGSWTGHCFENRKQNVDVRDTAVLLDNLQNDHVDYGAWWCFCIPVSLLDKYGLSLPFFIKIDDVEFSLRLKDEGPVITMNGAAVFHESFDKKMSMALEYYIVRNELVTAAIHDICTAKALRLFVYSMGKHLLLYRYDNIPLIIKAANDFLKGVDFFLTCDEEQLNKEVMQHSLKFVPLKEIPQWNDTLKYGSPSHLRKDGRLKAFAACFLPVFCLKKEVTAVAVPYASPKDFICRKTVIQYQLEGENGILTQRNFGQFVKYSVKALGMTIKLLFCFRKARKGYQTRKNEISSVGFWREHLGLK